jgi:putative MATE family efflux protein
MTQGNILGHIVRFALPLLLGNLFQQLYNMVDTWVVGNYVSNEAYSAVGSVGWISSCLISFFTGLATGAGVVIGQYYGAGQKDKVQQAVHTAIAMTLGLGVFFTGLGLVSIPFMLDVMNMPASVRPEATTYLTIYFSGVMGLMLYNMCAGILRAVGDSQRPFYFLVVCAVLNTVLDLLFVLVFDMGVAGVAIATILSQSVSAALVIITLIRSDNCIKLRLKKIRIHWDIMKKVFNVGFPTALQLSITSFGNVFVQSYINFFGPDCMSAWTTYNKVDQLITLPTQSFSVAVTTLVSQNLGAGKMERVRHGVKTGMIIALGSAAVLMIPVIVFAPNLATFFNGKAEVVEIASMFLRLLTPGYLIWCVYTIYVGALRGMGNTKIPTIIGLTSFVAFRQVYSFAMSKICNQIIPMALSYPLAWLIAAVAITIYYQKVKNRKSTLVE